MLLQFQGWQVPQKLGYFMFALMHSVDVPSLYLICKGQKCTGFRLTWLLMLYVVVHSVIVLSQSQLLEIHISVGNSSFTPVSSEIGKWLNPGDRGLRSLKAEVYLTSNVLLSLLNLSVHYQPALSYRSVQVPLKRGREFDLLAVLLCHALITMCFISYSILPC